MPGLTKVRSTKERKPRSPLTGKKSIPWRESARPEIEKYSETGSMVRAGRFKAGLTQKALAEQLDILPRHVSEMEHGKRSVSKKMAQKLSKVLNLDYRIFL